MKVLFFSTYYYPYISGITTYPKKVFSLLDKNTTITALTFKHNNQLKFKEKIDQVNVVRMPITFQLSKGFISLPSLFYFWQYARHNDLIILNIPNFEGLILALFAKIFNKKIIALYHCQVYLSKNIFKKIVNFFLNISIYIQLLLSEKIIGYTQDYVRNTYFGKRFFKKFIFSLPPIVKISASKTYLNYLLKNKEQNIWVGYSGRIAEEKGIEYLIQAVQKLENKKIKLVFAGPYGKNVAGENNYYQEIISLLKKYQLPYLFLGCLNENQLGSFYKSIDLLVLPSINGTEAFGMVQAESMLLGTPVIASNLPGVRVPIQLTQMGIIAQPAEPQTIQSAIEKILKNKYIYSNTQLIQSAQTIFDIKKVTAFYQQLILDLQD